MRWTWSRALASQAADEGKVGWGPLPTTEHYREEDPRDALIAELEASLVKINIMTRFWPREITSEKLGQIYEITRLALRRLDNDDN